MKEAIARPISTRDPSVEVNSVAPPASTTAQMRERKREVEIGLAIASFTYGGLLGFFLLGRMKAEFPASSVIAGFVASIAAMVVVVRFTAVAWPWYIIIGLSIMVATSVVLRIIQK